LNAGEEGVLAMMGQVVSALKAAEMTQLD
jgi:hypothetical protein